MATFQCNWKETGLGCKNIGILSRSIVSFFSRDHANLLCIVANFSISSLEETWNWKYSMGVVKSWDGIDMVIVVLSINCLEPGANKHFEHCCWTRSERCWMIPFHCSQLINHNALLKSLFNRSRFNPVRLIIFIPHTYLEGLSCDHQDS